MASSNDCGACRRAASMADRSKPMAANASLSTCEVLAGAEDDLPGRRSDDPLGCLAMSSTSPPPPAASGEGAGFCAYMIEPGAFSVSAENWLRAASGEISRVLEVGENGIWPTTAAEISRALEVGMAESRLRTVGACPCAASAKGWPRPLLERDGDAAPAGLCSAPSANIPGC